MNPTRSILRHFRSPALFAAAGAACLGLATALAGPLPVHTASLDASSPMFLEPDPAADRFADAPYGVDPVVTGPVTEAFRQRQERAGCDRAEWPDIPVACYPG